MSSDRRFHFRAINFPEISREDQDAYKLSCEILNDMLKVFREDLESRIVPYRKILQGCEIEFLIDYNNKSMKPVINEIHIPENKIKLVRLALSLIKNSKEEDLKIKRMRKFN